MIVDDKARLDTMVDQDLAAQAADQRGGQLTTYSCPDCGGTLWQQGSGRHLGFHCHVGHRLSPEVLLAQQAEQLEYHLWATVRVLTEMATATRQLATGLRLEGADAAAAAIEDLAALDEHYGDTLRGLVEGVPSPIAQPSALARILAQGDA